MVPSPDASSDRPRRAFITGVTGFAGSHLAELSLAEGMEVSGLSRRAIEDAPNLAAVADRVRLYRGDLTDPAALDAALQAAAPDYLFHLAAETSGIATGREMVAATVEGTANLLQAAARLSPPPRIVVVGSSAVYGAGADPDAALDETAPFAPAALYGMAKAAQDLLAERLGAALGLDVVRVRAFNHTGPRERPDFVASSVARQVAAMEAKGVASDLAIGRTDAVRDFSDVRDIVRGYWLAMTRGRPGAVYNLASGSGVEIGDLVRRLIALSPLQAPVKRDEARVRPEDVSRQVGDASRARSELGWRPEYGLDRTLADLLDDWRRKAPEE